MICQIVLDVFDRWSNQSPVPHQSSWKMPSFIIFYCIFIDLFLVLNNMHHTDPWTSLLFLTNEHTRDVNWICRWLSPRPQLLQLSVTGTRRCCNNKKIIFLISCTFLVVSGVHALSSEFRGNARIHWAIQVLHVLNPPPLSPSEMGDCSRLPLR